MGAGATATNDITTTLSLYVQSREFKFLIQNQGRPPHVSAIYADAPLVRYPTRTTDCPNAVRIGVLSYQPMTLELPEDLQRQAQIGNLPESGPIPLAVSL